MARREIGWRDVTVRCPDVPFLDWADVIAFTGFSETSIRRLIAEGQFPPQLRGGGWSDMQIAAWVLWRTHGPRPAEGEEDGDEAAGGERAAGTRKHQRPPNSS